MSRTNWMLNGGFESNLDNWAVYQSRSTLTRVTSERVNGAVSMRVVATDVSDVWGCQYIFIPSSGGTMTHSCYVKGEGTGIGRTFVLYLQANPGTATNSVVLTGSWQRVSVTQSGINFNSQVNLFYLVDIAGSSIGDVFYLDAVQLEDGTSATEYIDTDGYARTVGEIGHDLHHVPGAGLW